MGERSRRSRLEVLIDAIDYSYNGTRSDPEWLQILLETLAPELDRGCGLSAWLYDASDPRDLRLYHPTSIGAPSGTLEAIFASASHPKMPLDILGRHWATPAGICSEQIGSAYGDDFAPWRDTFFKFGIRDIVTINAYDVDGHGIAINAFHPKRVVLPPTYIEQLERVAVHLITSYRLRRAGTPNGFLADDVEAILTPDGHVHDARGEASTKREELTIATRLIERARGQLRRTTPEEALTIWRALVEARWSLVNFVDTDGKRFLIARVNDPKPTATTRLTAREHQIVSLAAHGHSNKLIGYELGIAEGTVGAHISAAMRKLGVTTRASLAALYAVETISDDHTNAKSPRT